MSLKEKRREAGALLGREFLEFEATSRLNLVARFNLDVAVSLSYQDRERFLRQAERLKIRLEDCGAIGGEVLDEYNQAKQRDEGYEKELNDLAAAEKSLREIMADLADKIESDFFGGVEKINGEFSKFFVSVFGGGKAELILAKITRRKTEKKSWQDRETAATNEDKEEETGVEISVSHPKKNFFVGDAVRRGEIVGGNFSIIRNVPSQSSAIFNFRRNRCRFG